MQVSDSQLSNFQLSTFNSILVVKLAGIGDVLLSTPALRALRETYSQARIDLLVPPGGPVELMRGTTLVDRVVVFDKALYDEPKSLLQPANWSRAAGLANQLRGPRYDAVVLLQHLTLRFGTMKYAALCLATGAPVRAGLDNGRGWFLTHRAIDEGFDKAHEAEQWLRVAAVLGAHTDDYSPALPQASPDDLHHVDALLAGKSRPLIALHPGSGDYSLARRWSPERYAQVADALSAEGATILLVGGPADAAASELVLSAARAPIVNLQGKTTLTQLIELLRRCDLFIGNDGGVMHLAAAAGIHVVAVFGPSNATAWHPWTSPDRYTVVQTHLECQPCFYRGHSLGLREGCATRDCLALITPIQVLRAARAHLVRAAAAPTH